jgi:sterol desaturase/sphingolipid hydroxylase (fatty acid hydroxylase superfamily)
MVGTTAKGRLDDCVQRVGGWETVTNATMTAGVAPPAITGVIDDVIPRRRARRLYPPAFVALAVTSWLAWRGVLILEHGGGVAGAIGSSRNQLIGPTVLALLLVVAGAERLWPAVRRPLLARGHVQDALYLVLYTVAVVPLVVVIGVGFSDALRHAAPWLVLPHLSFAPPGAAVVLAIVAMDACNWLAHWANHRITSLWRLHALHHSQEEMSILTSFRTHPLVHTSFLIAVVPAVALFANAVVPSTAIVIYLCLATFPHANVRWGFGPVGRIVVSPAYHRIHHAAEGRNDVNLGTVLTVWDVFSHRAVFPERGAAVIATGLAGRPVPLEQSSRRAHPLRAFAAQMVEPFVDSWPKERLMP